jgi:hypothetical protein
METVLMVIWTRTPWVWASCAILFVWGVAIFTMFPCYMSYLHTYARKDFLGRTFALMDQATYMPHTVAAAAGVGGGGGCVHAAASDGDGVGYLGVMLFMQTLPGMRLLRSRREKPPGERAG